MSGRSAVAAPPVRRSSPGIRTRADIQGLRAVAVGIVVVFHLWPGALPGGFVGVDVFFVISGYLITRIITTEVAATGSFAVTRFFVRRARRLVPLAGAVISATMVAGFVVLPATDWERLGRDAVASTLQFENWNLVASNTDYLHPDRGLSVLQNFWSLSAEWQSYVIWALVFGVLMSRAAPVRRYLIPLLLLVTCLPLALSILVTMDRPSLAYFGTPTRLWEFGAGALASRWIPLIAGRLLREVIGWAGIAAILLGAVLFSPSTPFPGIAAALPVVGTVAVLLAGEAVAPSSWTWLLSRAAPGYLGDRSYAIYLWHWPVLIMLERVSGHPSTAVTSVGVLAVTLALSVVTSGFIERPVRSSRRPRWTVAALVIATALPLALGGAAVAQAQTARSTLDLPSDSDHPGAAALSGGAAGKVGTGPVIPAPQVGALDYGPAGEGDHCLHAVAAPVSCSFGDQGSSRLVVLTGDSHAWQWIPALDLLGRRAGFRVETLVRPSCPLASTTVDIPGTGDDGTCALWRAATISRIVGEHPMAVIVGGLTPAGYEVIDYHVESARRFVGGYRAVWQQFTAAGIPVVSMKDVPYFSRDVADCVARDPEHSASCDEARSRVLDAFPDPLVAATAPGVRLIDLSDAICLPTVCPAVVGNVLVYRDRDHLTATYVRSLAPMLWAQLSRAAPFDDLARG